MGREAEPSHGSPIPEVSSLWRWSVAPAEGRQRLTAYVGALGSVAVTTLVAALLSHRLDPRNLGMVFLLGIAFAAARFGQGPSVLASLVGAATFEYFFVPPYFSFAEDPQYVFTGAVMLVVSLLISTLASRLRAHAEESRRTARRTQLLFSLTRDLAVASDTAAIAAVGERHVSEALGTTAWVLPAEGGGSDRPGSRGWERDWGALPDDAARAAARQALSEGRRTGVATASGTDSRVACLPLSARRGVVGLLVVCAPDRSVDSVQSLTLLELLAGQIAASIERALLAAEAEQGRIDVERERLRSALLSSVSHDLRTPLSTITGAATTLLQGTGQSAEAVHELSALIQEESERLNRLVGNLLDMTRVQSGELEVAREWHSIDEVVGAAVRRLRRVLREHVVRPDFPADLPLVPIDAVLVEQVIVNLLENAAKYTPKGSAVELSARSEPGFLVVEVADSGPGLPLAAGGAGGRAEGRGLGLAICRAIVAAHGGEVHATNRAGGGAVVGFRLPLRVHGMAVPEALVE